MPSWASRSPKSFLFSAGIRKLLKTHYTRSPMPPQSPERTAPRMPLERAEMPLGCIRATGMTPEVIRAKKVA